MLPAQQLTETNGRFIVQPVTKDLVIWKEGLYAFNKQKLGAILKRLELYYDVKITIENASILEHEYTGKFRQRAGVMEMLRLMKTIHPFKINRVEDRDEIILYR